MNGINRNCVWCALDKPSGRVSGWRLAEAGVYVALFIGLLLWAGA